MQAIITKYIGATNFKPSRVKASCERGSITISYDHQFDMEKAHIQAADALVAKFVAEDKERYGTKRNPWSAARVCGCLPSGDFAHVFTPSVMGAAGEMLTALQVITEHAKERFPHFESERGQEDIKAAEFAITKAKGA